MHRQPRTLEPHEPRVGDRYRMEGIADFVSWRGTRHPFLGVWKVIEVWENRGLRGDERWPVLQRTRPRPGSDRLPSFVLNERDGLRWWTPVKSIPPKESDHAKATEG